MAANIKEQAPQFRVGAGGEGGHWYRYGPDGNPECCYEVLGANGKWRAPTLRDAKKYDLFPGVTSIIKQAAAPGLERWKIRQSIMAALTHPQAHEIEDAEQLLRMIEADGKEEGRKAAERGTQIHAAIEEYYRSGAVDPDYTDYITAVRIELHKLTGVNDDSLWLTEETCCHPFGVGTRVDLYSRELNMVVDFKSKDLEDGVQVKAYPEQGQQLAVCKEMLGMQDARAVNLFVSRNNPGVVCAYEWPQDEHGKLWRTFCWLLGFYQVSKDLPLRVELEALK